MVINYFSGLFDGICFFDGEALALLKEKMIVSSKGHRVNFSNYEGVVLIF